uniref:DWNN domain-containing protein n=1 Tax=Myripristis murdjan TaxID=586833 RepID=A0A667ZI84_9TELE
MSCVHYRFSSKLDGRTATFSELTVSLRQLKLYIKTRECLKSPKTDLQILDAQTQKGRLS